MLNIKYLRVFALTFILLVTLVGQSQEQGQQPPLPDQATPTPPTYPLGKAELLAGSQIPAQAAAGANASTIALGAPGTNFRYLKTFGVTAEAYFSDTTHLNFPAGLGTDGSNVWIAEGHGNRALKYTSSGSFVTQIGVSGFRYGAAGTELECPSDVAVDSGGNIWITDECASHVAKFDATGIFVSELGQLWNWGSSNDLFAGPISTAFDSAGNIFVSDTGNHRVQVFTSEGVYSATIGLTGVPTSSNTGFDNPQHIAIADDLLYVADAGNQRVQIFNISNPAAATYVATLGVTGVSGTDNGYFDYPAGVGVDAGYIYVAEGNNNRVQIFNRTTRAFVAMLIPNVSFWNPFDVAVDSDGNIYVAERYNYRVQQFNSAWNYVRTLGTTGVPYLTDGQHYLRPSGVAVASDGSIYLAEEWGNRLLKLNASGTPQWVVGEAGVEGSDNNHFNRPQAVALDPGGHVYVADSGNGRIQIFGSDGTYMATLGSGWGSGNDQFAWPRGVAIDSGGNIYVADEGNMRVQIFNNLLMYQATLGVTYESGSDNAHFVNPFDVAVDTAGIIYVVDNSNHRVQVFNSSRAYVRTLGVSGVIGNDFDHFEYPTAVAVDATGRTYVADGWGWRIQVFDNTGAYLTSVGGSGTGPGKFRQVEGLGLDNAGNLYAADALNNNIQKFVAGVPGWKQANINGFGEPANGIASMGSFGGQLYVGTFNYAGNGAQLWRSSDGKNWSAVMTDGFGDATNVGIDHLVAFKDHLYAGTWNETSLGPNYTNGGQIWRSSNGDSWEQVVTNGFGDPTNGEVINMAVYQNQIYAATWSYTSAHGTEIWRSSSGGSGSWTRVVENGLGDATNVGVMSMDVFNGFLYAGTYSIDSNTGRPAGCEVWRTDGLTWSRVNGDGFGDLNCSRVSLAVLGNSLYAGTGLRNPDTQTYPGGQIWRCTAASGCDQVGDWSLLMSGGFGNTQNRYINSLIPFGSQIYAVTANYSTGMEVWSSSSGTNWGQVGFAGFSDSNNQSTYWDNSIAVFNNHLYIGTNNSANGGEIWQLLDQLYLPLLRR